MSTTIAREPGTRDIYYPAAAGGQPCIISWSGTQLRYTDAGIPAYWHGQYVTQVYFQGSRVNEWYRNGQQIYRRAKNYYRWVTQYRRVSYVPRISLNNPLEADFQGNDGEFYNYTGTYYTVTENEYHSESWA